MERKEAAHGFPPAFHDFRIRYDYVFLLTYKRINYVKIVNKL